jgi:transcription initiation factor TFIIE subunit alpha
MDFARAAFICEICHAEVVDNENAESVQGSKDRMQRFNHQMRFIREGLQKSEGMVLPACVPLVHLLLLIPSFLIFRHPSFDVAVWVKNNPSDADKHKAAQSGSGLKVAGSDPNRKEDDGIGVMMSMDKDETTQRLERDAEAEAKRQQNALPAWHLKSTISGDLTALGVKESARAEIRAGDGLPSNSNDDILRGLGVVGARPEQVSLGVVEEVKVIVNHESDCECGVFISTLKYRQC